MAHPSISMTEPVRVENGAAESAFLLICEHASNAFPAPFGTLGLGDNARRAHIAWDPGALGLARGLARRLDATLIAAEVSRLIYDCNRPPNSPGSMPATSEVFSIPGNAVITAEERWRRTEAVYLPFHAAVRGEIARRLALGRPPVVVTIHSFTPIYFGQPRAVEFGVIHDADPRYAERIVAAAQARTTLRCELNAPYSAADEVTHTLRLHATPYDLTNAMLEIRNDLIATAEAEEAMAETIAPVLSSALAELSNTPAMAGA